MNKFTDLSKVVSTDKLRFAMQYAVVIDGKIIATDSHILSMINLKIYIEDLQQLKNIEGKIFDAKLLKRLSKATEIIFDEDEIIITKKKNISRIFYQGTIEEKREMFFINEISGIKDVTSFGAYPNIFAVIPHYNTATGEIDFSKFKRKTTAYNIDKLNNLVAGFRNKNYFTISDEKNRPSIVLPIPYDTTEKNHITLNEIGLIMPVICKSLDLAIIDNLEKLEPVEKPEQQLEKFQVIEFAGNEPTNEAPPLKIEPLPEIQPIAPPAKIEAKTGRKRSAKEIVSSTNLKRSEKRDTENSKVKIYLKN